MSKWALYQKRSQQMTHLNRKSLIRIVRMPLPLLLLIISPLTLTQAVPTNRGSTPEVEHATISLIGKHTEQVSKITKDQLIAQEGPNKEVSLPSNSSPDILLDHPQGQCILNGEYVPETLVTCEKQEGCRAIQKTGHCCPDYKCDCQKDGKTYANGDKLVDPETPCTVCYCQGGEILCSSVTCFHRDDCTPKYNPGVCCPEYDNCPVSVSEVNGNNTIISTTAIPEIVGTMTTASNGVIAANAMNSKITIKEITKPVEIRITDDNKAIPIHQILKPTSPSATSIRASTTQSPSSTVKVREAPPLSTASLTSTSITNKTNNASEDSVVVIYSANLKNLTEIEVNDKADVINPSTPQSVLNAEENLPKAPLTVSQHPNQAKAIESSVVPRLSIENNGGESLKLLPSVAYSTLSSPTDMAPEAYEKVAPSLSVFADRDSSADPSKVNIKREFLMTTEEEGTNSNVTQPQQDSPSSYIGLLEEIEPEAAESDNIYHIIATTEGATNGSTTNTKRLHKPAAVDYSIKGNRENTLHQSPKSINVAGGITTEAGTIFQLEEEDTNTLLDANPAYPSLPEDDFSLRDVGLQLTESEDISEEPRSFKGSFSDHAASPSSALKLKTNEKYSTAPTATKCLKCEHTNTQSTMDSVKSSSGRVSSNNIKNLRLEKISNEQNLKSVSDSRKRTTPMAVILSVDTKSDKDPLTGDYQLEHRTNEKIETMH